MKKLSFFLLALAFVLSGCDAGFSDNESVTDGEVGRGGSMARFTIVGDYLYTVDFATLKTYDISNEANPMYESELYVGEGIETIFPYNGMLLIGSQWGVYLYSLETPTNPTYLSQLNHFFACDPVVAEGNHAYVTLSTERTCGSSINELQVLDISVPSMPTLVTSYPMTNPKGLGVDGDRLFVCDKEGIKVYDRTDPVNLRLIQTEPIKANDVIPLNGILLVVGDDGFFQYDYNDGQFTLLSSLPVAGEQ